MNIQKAKTLTRGKRVMINYNNVHFGEKINCPGEVRFINPDEVNKTLNGQEYIWVTVRYMNKESVFSSLHLH